MMPSRSWALHGDRLRRPPRRPRAQRPDRARSRRPPASSCGAAASAADRRDDSPRARRSRRAASWWACRSMEKATTRRAPTKCGASRAELEKTHGLAGASRRRAVHDGRRAARHPRDGRLDARPEGRRRCAGRHRAAPAALRMRRSTRDVTAGAEAMPTRRRGSVGAPADRCRASSSRRHRGAVGTGQVRVIVPRGASFASPPIRSPARVVSSPTAVPLLRMARGSDRDLKAGTYVFKRGASWDEVLDAISAAERGSCTRSRSPKASSLIADRAAAGARARACRSDSVHGGRRATPRCCTRLDVPTPTLEGYLFPDTYVFADGTTPRDSGPR